MSTKPAAKSRAMALIEDAVRSEEIRETLMKDFHLRKAHAGNVVKSARKAMGRWLGRTRGQNRKARNAFIPPPRGDKKEVLDNFNAVKLEVFKEIAKGNKEIAEGKREKKK